MDVYVVDEHGNRTTVECVPAKGRISLAALFEELLSQTMPGALGAIRNQATMMPGSGMLPYGALQGLPNYSGMLTPHIASAAAPQLAQAQAMMTDAFPAVLSANRDAPVISSFRGKGRYKLTCGSLMKMEISGSVLSVSALGRSSKDLPSQSSPGTHRIAAYSAVANVRICRLHGVRARHTPLAMACPNTGPAIGCAELASSGVGHSDQFVGGGAVFRDRDPVRGAGEPG
ncbi:hypothetical protein ACW9HR_29985 [Nocardia gipuzkoensis]